MPTSNATWNGYTNTEVDGMYPVQTTNVVSLNGQTIINGLTYSIVGIIGNGAYGMREDSSRKVYIIHKESLYGYGYSANDTFEHLTYDFNMQVGDSFYDSLYNWRPTVIAIDTIPTPGGMRRRFTISNKDGTLDSLQYDYWIEGVGSLKILANAHIYCFEQCFCLSFLTVNDSTTYQDTLACHYMPNGITEVLLANIRLYPSPASTTLTIDMQQCSSAITSTYTYISLYDALGQRIRSIPRQGSSKVVNVSLRSMLDGIYMATITDETGTEMMLGKFVVVK